MKLLIILVLTIGVAELDAYTDNKIWGKINHLRGALLRIPPIVGMSIWYYPYFQWCCDWYLLIIIGWLYAIYWIYFDIRINLRHHLKWNHLGTTAPTDIIFKTVEQQYIIKILLLILFSILLWK